MRKKDCFWSIAAIMLAAMLCSVFVSCKEDDNDGDENNSSITGYWVREAHLNNPVRNGSSGTVTSYGFQFLSSGTVYVFQVQHTGLGSRYSYAEAKTSWEKITERNGVSFYINPDKKQKSYLRTGNTIAISIASNPTLMKITGSGRMEAISADGWAEGTYVRVK